MVWSNPPSVAAAQQITSALWNTYVQGDLVALRDMLLGNEDLGADYKFIGGRALAFADVTDVAHGMTTIVPTSVFGQLSELSGTEGGLQVLGLRDVDGVGLTLWGINGLNASPTTGGRTIKTSTRNGSGVAAFLGTELALRISNDATVLADWYGNGPNFPIGINVGFPSSTAPGSQAGIIQILDTGFKLVGGTSPSITFDSTTSIDYVRSSTILRFTVASVERIYITAGANPYMWIKGTGSAAQPILALVDQASGFYQPTAAQLSITLASTECFRFAGGTLDFRNATTQGAGGGAAPTFITIGGGSGPATAAQNAWLKIAIGGATRYLMVWA